jgi:hypothetical protein
MQPCPVVRVGGVGAPLSSNTLNKEHIMDIANKVFIVTGGASGLGEGTARMLAREGAKVVIADLQAEKGQALSLIHISEPTRLM